MTWAALFGGLAALGTIVGTLWAAWNRAFPKAAQPLSDQQKTEQDEQDRQQKEEETGRPS